MKKQLAKEGFYISHRSKWSHKRNQQLEQFAKALKGEIVKRKVLPKSEALEESLEHLLARSNGKDYFRTRLRDYFLSPACLMSYGIHSISLIDAVKKYINPLCNNIQIKNGTIPARERLLYSSEYYLRHVLISAYKGTTTKTYVKLDFSNKP